jgi:hypothetical protein
MDIINLQAKARPGLGQIECYWFENANTNLKRTLFHRIVIPFAPFDSGLTYESRPVSTELTVEWIKLGLTNPSDLDGVVIAMDSTPDVEASIYLGHAHNPVHLEELRLTREGDSYHIRCRATIDFEFEGVAQNEPFHFEAVAKYVGEVRPRSS